jgi:anti-sigma factor RsiW
VNCDEAQTLLHAYLDGELDLVRALEIERHLGGCPACAGGVRRQRVLRDALAGASLYQRAPAGLRERVRASLRGGRRPGPALPAMPWRALAVAASVAFVAALLWAVLRPRPSREELLAQEVFSGHVRSLMEAHRVDVPSSNAHTVKPWLGERLDFSPVVKDLKDEDYPLVGGRLDYLDNRKVAALVYKRRDHVINLFEWPAGAAGDASPRGLPRQGYHLLHWREGGLNYWAVSDLNERELEEFAQLVLRSAGGR